MTEEVDLHCYAVLRPWVEAVIDYENAGDGTPYSNMEYDRALTMAGVTPPQDKASKTITASQVVAGGGVVATIAQASEQAQPIIDVIYNFAPILRIIGPYIVWVGIGGIFLGAGYLIYHAIDRRNRGL